MRQVVQYAIAVAIGLVGVILGWSAQIEAQEIQIEGVPVVTTDTDQDTTYSAGDGLELEGQVFKSLLPGQTCPPDSAVTGVAANGDLICSCLRGLTNCAAGCIDLLSDDDDNCGACDRACVEGVSCDHGGCRECDLVYQSCEGGEDGCYPLLTPGDSACALESVENPPGTQGYECSYINGCAVGYGCVLVNPLGGLLCARLCDPDEPWGPFGHPRCVSDAGAGYECVRATDFYDVLDEQSAWIGFCVESVAESSQVLPVARADLRVE